MSETSRRQMFDELSDDELALVFVFRKMNAAAKKYRETSGRERRAALELFEDASSDLASIEAQFADIYDYIEASEQAAKAERAAGWDPNP